MDGLGDLYEIYKNPSNVLFEEEKFLDYRPGSFHPIALGDTLKDGRYKIHHKLGYGGFSTVWLARDHRYIDVCSPIDSIMLMARRLEQWVSVKITKADRRKNSRELRSLRALAQFSNLNPGSKYIVSVLDDFIHEGPNGCH